MTTPWYQCDGKLSCIAVRHAPECLTVSSKPEGVWVAYNGDGSAFVPFAEEIEAYRYASPLSMRVEFVEYGRSLP